MKSIPAMSLPSLALLPPSRREIYWSQRREALHAQVHIMEVARLDKKESMVAITLLFEHLPIISLVAIFSIGCKKVYIVHIHVVVLPINIFVERIISFLYTDFSNICHTTSYPPSLLPPREVSRSFFLGSHEILWKKKN